MILDKEFASAMEATFEAHLKVSQEINPEQWQTRSLGTRFREWLGRLFSYWL